VGGRINGCGRCVRSVLAIGPAAPGSFHARYRFRYLGNNASEYLPGNWPSTIHLMLFSYPGA
jgi:hypothetical protein